MADHQRAPPHHAGQPSPPYDHQASPHDDDDDDDDVEHAAPPPPIPQTRQPPLTRTRTRRRRRRCLLLLLPATTASHGPSPRTTELFTISYLVLFSILGTLARLGLQWLTFYPAAPSTFPVLWPNFGGTLIMGFLAAHPNANKTVPLYIGLTTGFCGSLTSFSTFMRDIFLAFLNHLNAPATPAPLPREDGYSFMAGLAVVIITVAACCSALKAGAHLALWSHRFTPAPPFRHARAILDPLVVFLAWGAWLGSVFMSIWPPDRHQLHEAWRGQALFACVFAPLGCLLRFYISLKLNPVIPSFPLGTFAVNIFGTAVLGMAYDLQHVNIRSSGASGGRVACQVLQGIMDGFDGCLTTVSTWILEIDRLKTGHAWKYAFASIAAGVAVLVVVMGSVRWSVGWTAAACVTNRSW